MTSHTETHPSQAVFTHLRFSKKPVSPTPTPIRPTPTPTLPPVSTSATLVYGQEGNFAANSVNVNAGSLNNPYGLGVDNHGNLYVTDTWNNRVLYYPSGIMTATQVYGQEGSSTTNTGNVNATGLSAPYGAVSDSSGNLYIADEGNNRILYYPAGSTTATRVYGQQGSFTSDDGNIGANGLNSPCGIALDGSGNLYVADSENNRVLYYPAGSTTATRVYGQGGSFTSDSAGAGTTGLNYPDGVAVDSTGNLYIADSGNNRVLYYPTGSTIPTRVYGQGGNFTSNTVNNGGVSANSLNMPNGVAVDRKGNLYIADNENNRVLYYLAGSTTAIRVYGQGGNFTSNTVNNGGVGARSLQTPDGVALDSGGNLYITDSGNNRVLYYSAGSTIATRVYGQGNSFFTNTFNVSAGSLNNPFTAALDSAGNLYVADSGNNRVLYYPEGSTIATRTYGQLGNLATNTVNNGSISARSLNTPNGVTTDNNGNLYIADSGNNRVLYYPAGSTTATRVYGQGGSFTTVSDNNGIVTASSLNYPGGVALDSHGNLYIADTMNNRVLYYPAGSTKAARVYGQGGSFTTASNNIGIVSASSLNYPSGVALDSHDNLYIADTMNNRVLYYPAGSTTATRVYGQGGSFVSNDDNHGGISANSLNYVNGIALDSNGDLYIADEGNCRILYYPAGSTTATRVYGQAGSFTSNTVNNGGIGVSSFNTPNGVALDSGGNLYIVDSGNNRVLLFLRTGQTRPF